MKIKSYFFVIITLSLLNYSCSNDESYEIQNVQNDGVNIHKEPDFNKELNKKSIDSSSVQFETKTADGDPSNPIPPRD